MNDIALARKAISGDVEAFHELFTRYTKDILGSLYGLVNNSFLKDHLDPLDLFQDIWIKAFEGMKKGLFDADNYDSFRPWINKVAYNVFVDSYRKARNESQHIIRPNSDCVLESIIDLDEGVEESVGTKELREILYEAIESLPDSYKEPYVLYEIEEFSYQEIAELLGLSMSNVKIRIHRAKEMLRKALKGYRDPLGGL